MAKILIVDDDATLGEFIRRGLEKAGHEPAFVNDAYAALDRMSRRPFDVLLPDIAMPEMDGISLALKASNDYPRIRIILISGYAEERERAHNLDALIQGLLAKPFTLETLEATIATALA